MSFTTVFKVSFLLVRTKVELCVSCTVLARSHSENAQKGGKVLPGEDSFWCTFLGKTTADDRSYFNMLVARKSTHTTPDTDVPLA